MLALADSRGFNGAKGFTKCIPLLIFIGEDLMEQGFTECTPLLIGENLMEQHVLQSARPC